MMYYAKSESPIQPAEASEVPPPLIIWGPGDPRPTLPIAGWNPGSGTWPIPPAPEQPPDGYWGAGGGMPTNPIAEPPWGWGNPAPQPPVDVTPKFDVKYIWTAETGWMTVIVPTGPTVTPSKKK